MFVLGGHVTHTDWYVHTCQHIKHNHKQWKLMCKQQVLTWTGRYTITNYRHTKLF